MPEFRGTVLNVQTLAKLWGVCQMTIYRYLKLRDPLPGHKASGKIFFFKDEVERWLKEKR
jgi:predicted DNA-binding transcriptional regulator AlpA